MYSVVGEQGAEREGACNVQRNHVDAKTSRINAAFKIYDIYSSRHGKLGKRVAGILLR